MAPRSTAVLAILAALWTVGPSVALAQRSYGEARYTAHGAVGLGASDLGIAASVEAEATDWRWHPLGVGFRLAVLGHAAFQIEERTVALAEPEVSYRFGSRRSYLVVTVGVGAAWLREVHPQACDVPGDGACVATGMIRHDGFHPTASLAIGPVHHVYGSLALLPTLRLDMIDADRWSALFVLGLGGTVFDHE